jgi:hypothetical protein
MTEKWNNGTIGNYVMDEGLGYAVMYGLDADSIEDVELKKLWKKADEALDKVLEYLKKECPDIAEYL